MTEKGVLESWGPAGSWLGEDESIAGREEGGQ